MKIIIRLSLLLFAISFTNSANAQQSTLEMTLSHSIGDDAVSGIENSNGNFVVVGNTYIPTNNFDPVITEISPAGLILQTKTFSTTSIEILKSVCQTSDGGYFITGSVAVGTSNYNWLVMKVDAAFNPIFIKNFGTSTDDNANRGFEISPGHYAITGSLGLGGSVKPSVVVVDDSGTIIHEGYLSTNQFASPDYKGHYFGNGEIGITHLTNAVTLLDTTGTLIKHYAFSAGIFSTDVIKGYNGEYVCVSVSSYGAPTGSTLSLTILDSTLTTNTGGNVYKATGKDLVPVSIIQDNNLDYIIASNAFSLGSGLSTPVLIKANSSGVILWSKSYLPSGSTNAVFNSLMLTSDGGYFLTGNDGPFNNQHMFIAKLDSSGNSNCTNVNFPLTTLAASVQSATTHAAYSGTAPVITPVTYTTPTLTLTPNLLCVNTGLEQHEVGNQLTISPNFFHDGFKIESGMDEPLFIELYDLKGCCVMVTETHNNGWIDASKLEPGYYFIKTTGLASGAMISAKILKY